MKNQTYRNIEDPTALISLVMFEALTRTSLSRLAGVDMGFFKEGAASALDQGLGLVSSETATVKETAKNLLNFLGK
jgi:hypothetical protein